MKSSIILLAFTICATALPHQGHLSVQGTYPSSPRQWIRADIMPDTVSLLEACKMHPMVPICYNLRDLVVDDTASLLEACKTHPMVPICYNLRALVVDNTASLLEACRPMPLFPFCYNLLAANAPSGELLSARPHIG